MWFGSALITSSLIAWNFADAQRTEALQGMLVQTDVMVATRAGFNVAANVYRPDKPGRFPVIVSMGPYGKDALPAEYEGLFETGQIVVSEYAAFETPDPEYWVHYDYVVIAADSPGSGKSGGDLDLFGPTESNAFYDLVEWAGEEPWSNGNVGLGGVSYFGMTQWYVAALGPPHLKAIMPGEALTDIYRDAVRHGGIPSDFVPSWMQYRIRPAKTQSARLLSDLEPALQERPFYDGYWASLVPDLANITVPAYVIASWPDHGLHTRGTLIGFEQMGSEEKWLEVHGRKKWEYYYSRDSLERQRRFFDRFLRGIDTGITDVRRVRYERRNAFYDGDVLYADAWPLPGTEARTYYLHADGRLDVERPRDSASLSYQSLDADEQLVFQYTFVADTEITGAARLKLWVEADGADDMDLYVGLSKLDRNGNEVSMAGYNDVEHGHVASGWLRVSHRELDAERSTALRPFLRHERQLKLAVGERVSVEIEILPSSTFFREGESLVVRVQGTELAGAGGIEHLYGVNAGRHLVHMGGEYDSQLTIPIISR